MNLEQDIEELLLMLLREGSRGHAIDLFREETGAGRAEARQFVDELAARHGLRSGRSWFSLGFLSEILPPASPSL